MSENLSVDEIIRQAEEIRKKTITTARSAMEDIDSSAREITQRDIEVPKIETENIVIEPSAKPAKKELTHRKKLLLLTAGQSERQMKRQTQKHPI